ncbi:MAG: S49 family peptidase [Ignavibacteria bacterium]|nr:S49 family peptidase [Ignavibacteria bacterium]
MPNWKEVLEEIQVEAQTDPDTALDKVRRKYLHQIFEKTNRNVIAYYSGWLQKGADKSDVLINDKDKAALMLNIHRLDRSLGLDLILHTPGGDIAATESIVDYLYSMFGKNIRAIIPQISMSAGTMIALSCKEIIMGKHSNLGPIDPQMGGVPCQGVLAEFQKAKEDVKINPHSAPLWQSIISKYHPTFLGACQNAIDWSEILVKEWLDRHYTNSGKILSEFSDHASQKTHARHISVEKCKNVGLNIVDLEGNQELQEAVLTAHHAFMHTFAHSSALKVIENQLGIAYIESAPV